MLGAGELPLPEQILRRDAKRFGDSAAGFGATRSYSKLQHLNGARGAPGACQQGKVAAHAVALLR